MEIFKVVGLGLAATFFAVLLKGWRPEIAIQISLAASAVIFFVLAPYLRTVVEMFRDCAKGYRHSICGTVRGRAMSGCR